MVTIINTSDIARMSNLTNNETDWVYNGLDCCVTLEVLHSLQKNTDEVCENTYQFSLALQAPILEMQLRGILRDERRNQELLDENNKKIHRLATNLQRIFEEGFGLKLNWRSPKQLCSLFYDVMELPEIKKRSVTTGKYGRTVDQATIEKLKKHFYAEPICNHILHIRDYDKQRSSLETPVDADGRFRSTYNIAGTKTGRFSSAESAEETGSNAQNVTRKLRETFRSSPGYVLVNFDLEQADSRNVGAICWALFHDSHGPTFAGSYLDACESGDLHTQVCKLTWPEFNWTHDAKANRIIADQVWYRADTYRDMAKKLGHGSNYIGQPATMAAHAKIPVAMAASFQKSYFEIFPCIPEYHKSVDANLRLLHYTQTLHFNRRRFYFGRANDPETLRGAVANDPQSMTADEINQGILNIWRRGGMHLLAQVHDNILIECREEMVNDLVPEFLNLLEVPMILKGGRKFTVPLEAKLGYNWGDTKYNSDGTVKSNPYGLQAWKGEHTRSAPIYIPFKKNQLSLQDLL